jgi:hypothetical protein
VLWENATALAGHQAAVEGAPRTIVLYSEAGQQADAASHPYFVSVVGRLRSCSERNRRISDLLSSTTAPAPQGGEQYILTTLCYGVQGPAIFASAIDVLPTAMD